MKIRNPKSLMGGTYLPRLLMQKRSQVIQCHNANVLKHPTPSQAGHVPIPELPRHLSPI